MRALAVVSMSASRKSNSSVTSKEPSGARICFSACESRKGSWIDFFPDEKPPLSPSLRVSLRIGRFRNILMAVLSHSIARDMVYGTCLDISFVTKYCQS